jgi:hypothetical protein
MKRFHGVPLLAAFVIAVVLAIVVFLRTPMAAPAQAVNEVGVAAAGRNAIEFTGHIDQEGTHFTAYGYLTHIAGITTTLLYTDNNPLTSTAATARFTFSGTAELTSRSVVSNVFTIIAEGNLTYYFNENGGADFADPASFAEGIPIAAGDIRIQNILTVIGPNVGMTNGNIAFDQNSTAPFTLEGNQYRLGRNGLQERLEFTGLGNRLEPVLPRAIIVVAGNAIVTGSEVHLPLVEN